MDLALVNRMAGITRGGGEIWDLKMVDELENHGADVTFYVGKPLRSELPEPVNKFDTVEIPTPHLQDLAYAAPLGVGGMLAHLDARVFCRRVVKSLRQHDHDLVQICSRPHFDRYVDRIDAPVSIVMHGEPYSLWHHILKPWGSTYDLLEEFDQMITIEEARAAIDKQTTCFVETINPGVDTDLFRPGENMKIDTKRVSFVGRFVPAKNLLLFIEAFDAVANDHPDAESVLIGDGPKRNQIKSIVERRDLTDRIKFPGYVPNEELPDWYRSASVFTLSSKSENHPITILKPMSCGTPVVAPRVGSIPSIVQDENTGLLYST